MLGPDPRGAACRRSPTTDHPDHGPLCATHAQAAEARVECPVCLAAVRAGRRKVLQCGHAFHPSCIRRWFRASWPTVACPCCRTRCLRELRGKTFCSSMSNVMHAFPVHHFATLPTYAHHVILHPDIMGHVLRIPPELELAVRMGAELYPVVLFLTRFLEVCAAPPGVGGA